MRRAEQREPSIVLEQAKVDEAVLVLYQHVLARLRTIDNAFSNLQQLVEKINRSGVGTSIECSSEALTFLQKIAEIQGYSSHRDYKIISNKFFKINSERMRALLQVLREQVGAWIDTQQQVEAERSQALQVQIAAQREKQKAVAALRAEKRFFGQRELHMIAQEWQNWRPQLLAGNVLEVVATSFTARWLKVAELPEAVSQTIQVIPVSSEFLRVSLTGNMEANKVAVSLITATLQALIKPVEETVATQPEQKRNDHRYGHEMRNAYYTISPVHPESLNGHGLEDLLEYFDPVIAQFVKNAATQAERYLVVTRAMPVWEMINRSMEGSMSGRHSDDSLGWIVTSKLDGSYIIGPYRPNQEMDANSYVNLATFLDEINERGTAFSSYSGW